MKLIGYMFTGPKAPSRRVQLKALKEAGLKEDALWEDTKKTREERRDMIDLDVREPGDIVLIYSPAIMGSGKVDTAKAVLAIGAKGAAVQVVGADPIVYLDQKQADNFAVEAVRVSRITNARINVEAGTVGRKEKWTMTDEAETLLRILWHDKRVPMARVLDVVKWLGGATITRENLYSRLGPRDPVSTDEEASDG